MNIPRHPFDRNRSERNRASDSKLVEIKIGQTKSDIDNLSDLIDAVVRKAFLTAALEPQSSEIARLFRDAAQCGAAAFVLAGSDREVDLPLASDAAMRLRGPVPPFTLSAAVWLSSAWCAMAANDFPSLMDLCYAPPNLLRNSPNRDDDFAYLYVDAVRAFWLRDPKVGQVLLEALRATDPARILRRDVDYVMSVDVPCLDLFLGVLENDEARFQKALAQAVEDYKEFWGASSRRNDTYGLVALAPTAFAALGVGRGLHPGITSDYMPAELLSIHSQRVPLVCCPYCLIPMAEGTELCPGCFGDVRKDAPFDMDSVEYFESPRKNCSNCKSHILQMAARCPVCHSPQ